MRGSARATRMSRSVFATKIRSRAPAGSHVILYNAAHIYGRLKCPFVGDETRISNAVISEAVFLLATAGNGISLAGSNNRGKIT